ncbi:MAG: hypothetical protein ACE5J3_05710 [Methanosarcinales archaeon]
MTEEKKIKRRSFVKILSGFIGATLFSSYIISLLRSSIPIIRAATPERETVLTYKGRELKVEDLPEGEGLNATYLGYDYKGKEKEYLVVVVEVQDNLVIEGDNQKITQIFSNLISNAIKYTHDGGKICIKVEERV